MSTTAVGDVRPDFGKKPEWRDRRWPSLFRALKFRGSLSLMWSELKNWARAIKRETLAAYFAVQDPRTPRLAKAVGVVVVAYALSPIDLIPDFIPVLGYLDDVIFVPAGLWLLIRLVPSAVMEESRTRAAASSARPQSKFAGAVIVFIWLAVAGLAALWIIASARNG